MWAYKHNVQKTTTSIHYRTCIYVCEWKHFQFLFFKSKVLRFFPKRVEFAQFDLQRNLGLNASKVMPFGNEYGWFCKLG